MNSACAKGHIDIIKALLKSHPDLPRRHIGVAFFHAAVHGQIEPLKTLVDYGLNINHYATVLNPLDGAVRFDRLNAIDCMLKHGFDLQQYDSGSRALLKAVQLGREKTVHLLITAGVPVEGKPDGT